MAPDIVFKVDAAGASIYVSAVFPADIQTLWQHFIRKELVDLWWAPRPWTCQSQHLNFTEGGTWRYEMVGPAQERHLAGATFNGIQPNRSFDKTEYFCEESGEINLHLPVRKTVTGFTGIESGTKLTLNIHFENETDLQSLLTMGFEQGLSMALQQLFALVSYKP